MLFARRWLEAVDGRSPVPLFDQIATRLKGLGASGALADGDVRPSVRQLAAELRVNPATVVRAYHPLEADGFAEMRQRSSSVERSPGSDRRARERAVQARRVARDLLADAGRLGVSVAELRRALDDQLQERVR